MLIKCFSKLVLNKIPLKKYFMKMGMIQSYISQEKLSFTELLRLSKIVTRSKKLKIIAVFCNRVPKDTDFYIVKNRFL
jgi:hypothetical protein